PPARRHRPVLTQQAQFGNQRKLGQRFQASEPSLCLSEQPREPGRLPSGGRGVNTPTIAPANTVLTSDGTQIYYKDWGNGQPIVFSHGWPLDADSWDSQMRYFADQGYRCIAHDRRGHGRSSQSWTGNDMDTYADDLAGL